MGQSAMEEIAQAVSWFVASSKVSSFLSIPPWVPGVSRENSSSVIFSWTYSGSESEDLKCKKNKFDDCYMVKSLLLDIKLAVPIIYLRVDFIETQLLIVVCDGQLAFLQVTLIFILKEMKLTLTQKSSFCSHLSLFCRDVEQFVFCHINVEDRWFLPPIGLSSQLLPDCDLSIKFPKSLINLATKKVIVWYCVAWDISKRFLFVSMQFHNIIYSGHHQKWST